MSDYFPAQITWKKYFKSKINRVRESFSEWPYPLLNTLSNVSKNSRTRIDRILNILAPPEQEESPSEKKLKMTEEYRARYHAEGEYEGYKTVEEKMRAAERLKAKF
ncbi:MAG: hypothetical protein ACTSP1_04125 [Candidatus Freyarchaeota archaeon]